jgi:hypothetical protein
LDGFSCIPLENPEDSKFSLVPGFRQRYGLALADLSESACRRWCSEAMFFRAGLVIMLAGISIHTINFAAVLST